MRDPGKLTVRHALFVGVEKDPVAQRYRVSDYSSKAWLHTREHKGNSRRQITQLPRCRGPDLPFTVMSP